MKYISNSNWKSSKFYVLPKVHNFKKIIEETNESNNICVNMEQQEDFKKDLMYLGLPNSPTQGISGHLEKLLTHAASCLKTYINNNWSFIRKLQSNIDFPSLLASYIVVSLHTSIPHNLELEAFLQWLDQKIKINTKAFYEGVYFRSSFIPFVYWKFSTWYWNVFSN